ncbi:glycerol acyltransferase [bacterium]|nr:glycerol acyltransferase [bacterium]
MLEISFLCSMWSFLFKAYLKLNGWKFDAHNLPADLKKFVLIAAPHTSNRDYPLAQAAFYLMGMKVHFLAKKSLFQGPFGKLFYRWGGIPVDRSSKFNMVEQLKEKFVQTEELALVISPEGTRKAVPTWKSGYYYIAKEAGVPIVCGYLDYKKKVAGIGPVVSNLADFDEVKSTLREFYRGISPKFSNNYNPDFE